MKSFALVVVLLVSSCGAVRAQSVQAKNGLEQSEFTGRVKLVEVGRIEYALRDGRSVEGRRIPLRKTAYDARGRRAEEVTYDQTGSVSGRSVYTYDAAGRNTGHEEYSSLSDKSLAKPRRHVYVLDGAGRPVEYTVYDSDGGASSRFTYAYDAAGNKTEEAFYSWQGQRTGKLVYTHDARGHVLTQTSYNADDAVSWKNVNVYDARGNWTRKTFLVKPADAERPEPYWAEYREIVYY
jgi:hypothetical protein